MSREDIIRAPGLNEACCIMFADKADEKLNDYILAGTKTSQT
jgi:hypothetical protein